MKSYTISKRFTRSIKREDGSLDSFTSELTTTAEVNSADELIAENSKLFAQVKWLTDNDIASVEGTL